MPESFGDESTAGNHGAGGYTHIAVAQQYSRVQIVYRRPEIGRRRNTVLLTNLIYTATISGTAQPRAAVRFVVTLSPSDAQMATYPLVTWQNLPWPQGICSPTMGLRQVWVRTELQLIPYGTWTVTNSAGQQAVPYFDSSAFCYAVVKQ